MMLAAVRGTAVRAVVKEQLTPAAWHALRGFSTGSSKVTELQSDADYQAALKDLAASKGAAVIDFTAKWCGPCKMIAPVYEALAQEFPSVRFLKVDIDNPAVSQTVTENSVAAVPTFVGYKGADRVTAFSGADRAMLRRLAMELSGAHIKAPQ